MLADTILDKTFALLPDYLNMLLESNEHTPHEAVGVFM
ncbi:hypothetical protein A2U01_0112500, partial [Trifolium medium]|nr:hypothetical protein [Trifolium medium]